MSVSIDCNNLINQNNTKRSIYGKNTNSLTQSSVKCQRPSVSTFVTLTYKKRNVWCHCQEISQHSAINLTLPAFPSATSMEVWISFRMINVLSLKGQHGVLMHYPPFVGMMHECMEPWLVTIYRTVAFKRLVLRKHLSCI